MTYVAIGRHVFLNKSEKNREKHCLIIESVAVYGMLCLNLLVLLWIWIFL